LGRDPRLNYGIVPGQNIRLGVKYYSIPKSSVSFKPLLQFRNVRWHSICNAAFISSNEEHSFSKIISRKGSRNVALLFGCFL